MIFVLYMELGYKQAQDLSFFFRFKYTFYYGVTRKIEKGLDKLHVRQLTLISELINFICQTRANVF